MCLTQLQCHQESEIFSYQYPLMEIISLLRHYNGILPLAQQAGREFCRNFCLCTAFSHVHLYFKYFQSGAEAELSDYKAKSYPREPIMVWMLINIMMALENMIKVCFLSFLEHHALPQGIPTSILKLYLEIQIMNYNLFPLNLLITQPLAEWYQVTDNLEYITYRNILVFLIKCVNLWYLYNTTGSLLHHCEHCLYQYYALYVTSKCFSENTDLSSNILLLSSSCRNALRFENGHRKYFKIWFKVLWLSDVLATPSYCYNQSFPLLK